MDAALVRRDLEIAIVVESSLECSIHRKHAALVRREMTTVGVSDLEDTAMLYSKGESGHAP